MRRLKLSITILLTMSGASASPPKQQTYIDVACSETASANPSIDSAIRQASALRRGSKVEAVTIRFSSGVCRLDRPIVLTQTDSGDPSNPLVLEGAEDGGTVITGAFPLVRSDNGLLSNLLPPETKNAAINYKLSPRATSAAETPRGAQYPALPASVMILQGNRWLRPARWPDRGYAQVAAASPQKGPTVWPRFRVPENKVAAWSNERDIWFGGYWTWDWIYETVKVSTIDPASGVARTTAPLRTKYDENPQLYYFVYNAMSELTEPGEYVLDKERGEATIWPYPGSEPESVETNDLLEIQAAHDVQIRHIIFRGALDTAVLISNSDRVHISENLVAAAGKTAIRIEGGHDNQISRTAITNIGETAVVLRGGDRTTLNPAGHSFVDSIVTRYGMLTKTYRPAVAVEGVGIRVEGSLFEDASFGAIMFEGNENIIRENEFAHVVREAGDAGAIYSFRNVSWRGNVIEGNYFHDILPDIGPGKTPRGVYLDDFVSGNHITKNVFYNVTSPVYLHGGSGNTINHNFFACVRPDAIHLHSDPEGWIRVSSNLTRMEAASRAGIPQSSIELYLSRYPDLDRGLSPLGYLAKNNRTHDNIVAGPGEFVTVGPKSESFIPPERISALNCDVPNSHRAGYVADQIERFGLKLADRRSALKGIAYYDAALEN